MGQRDYFKLGDHNAVCYVCGFKRKASEMKLRWDGVYVCKEDWEIRQPQDFVRGVGPEQAPAWTQPEQPDQFVQPVDNPLTNIVVGTPTIFLNGVLTTTYTIVLPQGVVTFNTPPPSGTVISWSGQWLDNASQVITYTNFPLYNASGYTTVYPIYGVN